MAEHLSEQQIENYNRRKMPPADLRAADGHLAACPECRRKVGEKEQLQEMFASLRKDILTPSSRKKDHVSYEQLADYIDKKLSGVENEIVENHLELCPRCASDMENLHSFKFEMEAYPAKDYSPPDKRSLWERFVAFWRMPAYSIPLQAASAAAIALIFAWIATLPLRNQISDLQSQVKQLQRTNDALEKQVSSTAELQAQLARLEQEQKSARSTIEELQIQIARSQQTEAGNSILLAVNDGAGRVILDRQGNLTGLKSLSSPYQEAVKTALTRQKVEPPPFLAKLTERSGTLLSGSGEGISFAIYSPVGTAVGTDRPTFRWQALSGAENYIVTIYDSNYSKVETSEPLSGTEWNLPRPLVRGGIYIWKVTALKDGKKVISPQPPAPEARFKVLEKTRADELEQARQAYSNSHLLLGTLYGQAGLLDDSEREFQLLLDANPGLPVAQKLLRNVRALRRQK